MKFQLILISFFYLNITFATDLNELMTGHYHNKNAKGPKEISNIYLINHSEYKNRSKIEIHFMSKTNLLAEFPHKKTKFSNKKIILDHRLRKSRKEISFNKSDLSNSCDLKIIVKSDRKFSLELISCSDLEANYLEGEYMRQDLGEHTKIYQKEVQKLERK
ncbi:hypothetical protein N9N67_10030 [Bacteriovoracaceae bacterium]|nr:hypothetical protein [Bacteriovoracaceae bacterium]